MEGMSEYTFTDQLENEVLRKRPYLKKEWCIRFFDAPLISEGTLMGIGRSAATLSE